MTQVFNQQEEKPKRRVLRRLEPKTEAMVWKYLRGAQLAEAKFRRQYSVDQFVLDLYCPEVQLAIELDGASHAGEDAAAYDRERQVHIESLGIEFLRFTNQQVQEDLEGVLVAIEKRVRELREEKKERAALWEKQVRSRRK